MDESHTNAFDLDAVIGHEIRLVGDGIDIFGVVIIVLGIAWSGHAPAITRSG